MAEIVNLVAGEGLFRGLAKQNLLFHQCIGELVDNAIAATSEGKKFDISIIFISGQDQEYVDLYICDKGRGMSLDILKKALQLGQSATNHSRLNEHGFGLKNALATLSDGNGLWELWTKAEDSKTTPLKVCGPFKPEMILDYEEFPNHDFLPTEISTLIKVKVKKRFINTSQGRGGRATELNTLRTILIEHLGVMYRGYLDLDPINYEESGRITVSIERDSQKVVPVKVPIADMKTEYFSLELGGKVYQLQYFYGTLDEVRRDTLIKGQKAKYYYQGNIPTQGIDIRLGKRVIATRLLDIIWKVEGDSSKNLVRHNNYNDFVGELIIPELPRGILTTVNNKTDFNLADENWEIIFDKLNEFRPLKQSRLEGEKQLRDKWANRLRASFTDSRESVLTEKKVWDSGARIDVYRVTAGDKIIIYELKVGTGEPIHLYQLKMYWDGLVIEGQQPDEAVLLVENYDSKLEEMANKMNTFQPIIKEGKPYNFNVMKFSEVGLMKSTIER
ncbi:ATP-binding protein [Turicibacter sanguinis]|uniref:ATP-binding protein n=1 Tax=Turicibacter sanguinis TaxID=154288 RepID=UPI00232D7ECE|nr:ATP-binding protein [Turicibacter sanguinis]MDB8576035.1 ATP-binding protein [Turicibacter sanguinis]MDB8579098.1 ATP-binding protein [Turicibacter sanguinis]MDB8584941.1 ATP-binding protein [Turicibacter sanguinis]MDB8587917.1 ATP-binding protein [Turicibacter sanguinis]MDB8598676.1 ATP-binding protein [Turicibacter sanguinis]